MNVLGDLNLLVQKGLHASYSSKSYGLSYCMIQFVFLEELFQEIQ